MSRFSYISNLLKFAYGLNRALYLSIFLALVAVLLELLAMSSLLPLFGLISGQHQPVGGMFVGFLIMVNIVPIAMNLVLSFVVLLTLSILTQLISQSLLLYLGRRVMAQLASSAFERIIHSVPIQEVSQKSIGYYISLAGDESFRASMLVISITQFVGAAALAILYYVAIAKYSLVTAGLVLAFLLISLLALFGVIRKSHRLGARQIEESRSASSVFLDAFNNLKAVRAFTAERYVVETYRSRIFQYTKTLFLVDEMTLLSKLLPVLVLISVFSVWFVTQHQSMGNMSIAFIVTMIAYLMRFFPVVGQGVHLLMRIVSDAKAGKDVTRTLSHVNMENSAKQLVSVDEIIFEQVSFGFEEHHHQKLVLNQVSLKFVHGRSYALSGRSGMGKSTLIDLLLKFYPPNGGNIYLNQSLLSEISVADVRKRIILVSQDAAVFDDTVVNNISLGMDVDMATIVQACKAACIHDVIEQMRDGYATRMQYQGKNLSGGQRQRIAIARALLRKPDVLILDESTSALDKATQKQVIENVLEQYTNKIVIFVTHDPYIMGRVSETIDLATINHQ